jgi:hypothetical protein
MNMDGKRLQNASDVVSFYESKQMEKHDAYPNARRQVFRFFPFGETKGCKSRSAMWDCKNIVGTQSLHFVDSIYHRDVTLLKLRNLTCFCLECMGDNFDICENKSQVQPRKLRTLEPINITQVNIHIFLHFKALTLQIILLNYYYFLIFTFFKF